MTTRHNTFDVVIIGAGAAGIMAAIGSAAASSAPATLLISDGPLGRSNTVMAQGGIQVPPEGVAARERMLEDMRRSARIPIDEDRAGRFVAAIPDTVARLTRWGLDLDRDASGHLVRRTAGGLSEPRIVSVRDQLGPLLVKALRRGLESTPAEVWTGGRVVAVEPTGDLVRLDVDFGGTHRTVSTPALVVATGGRSHDVAVHRAERSTNPANDNATMYGLIRSLGVPEEPGDHFQYQPFGMVEVGGAFGRCVPESIVSLTPRLLDRHGEEIPGIGQDRYDLTHRIFSIIESGDAVDTGGGPGVWLDLAHVPSESVAASFPKLIRTLDRNRLSHTRILVRPYLHYQLGGFLTDPSGGTPVQGLRLAGEMVGGLHGMNRLMGNGITDSLVHGRAVGLAAASGA